MEDRESEAERGTTIKHIVLNQYITHIFAELLLKFGSTFKMFL